MRPLVIINPAAGGGKAGRRWPRLAEKLRESLGDFDVAFTTPSHSATQVALDAAGRELIIAAGGDGTMNEIINGMVGAASQSVLAVLPLGTGNDFARGLGITSRKAALDALRCGKSRLIDLGRITFTGPDGTKGSRHFANVASLGLIGEVVQAAQGSALKRLFGSKLAYPLHALQVLRRYGGHSIEIEMEDGSVKQAQILAAAIANGRYFGAGMKVAPHAALDDGLLDVLVAETTPKFRTLDLRLLYSGKHVDHPAISHFKARRVRFTATDGSRMLCETDGELQGEGPCEIEVMAGKLRVIA